MNAKRKAPKKAKQKKDRGTVRPAPDPINRAELLKLSGLLLGVCKESRRLLRLLRKFFVNGGE